MRLLNLCQVCDCVGLWLSLCLTVGICVSLLGVSGCVSLCVCLFVPVLALYTVIIEDNIIR